MGALQDAGAQPLDVRFRLDGDRLRLEREQAKANLRKLKQEYERNVELHEKGLVSAGAFESLKYDLDALRAAYERAELELSYTAIRAPFDAIVTERYIKVASLIPLSRCRTGSGRGRFKGRPILAAVSSSAVPGA